MKYQKSTPPPQKKNRSKSEQIFWGEKELCTKTKVQKCMSCPEIMFSWVYICPQIDRQMDRRTSQGDISPAPSGGKAGQKRERGVRWFTHATTCTPAFF